MEIPGAKVLVTGGSAGIGRGIAAALCAEGAEVSLMARDRSRLERAAAELDCGWIEGDVGVEKDALRAVETFVRRHGRIDVLVNNAGIGDRAPLERIDLARFEAVLRTNLIGAMLMAREAARHFVRQGSGHLINIGSTSALSGDPGASAYAASKFALRGMSECWRAELRRHGVRVVLVNPSEVVTGFGRRGGAPAEAPPNKLRPEDVAAAVLGVLRMDDRGFVPELAIFATNPF